MSENVKEEMSTNLIEADNGLKADLTTAVMSYSSLVPKTDEEKSMFFNLINNPTKKLRDAINMEIKLKHVYAETVDFIAEETGDITPGVRMVFISDDNVSYQSASVGIFNCTKKLFSLFGEPSKWKKPITIIPRQVSKGEKKVVLTFDIKA